MVMSDETLRRMRCPRWGTHAAETKSQRNAPGLYRHQTECHVMGSRRYAWVKSMACCVCGYTGDTEAHHEPPRSRGGKDKDIVPLCSECHASRHSIQELIPKGHSDALLALAWWEGTGVDLREVRRDMVQAKAAQHGRSKRGCRKPLTHTPLSDLGILLIEE